MSLLCFTKCRILARPCRIPVSLLRLVAFRFKAEMESSRCLPLIVSNSFLKAEIASFFGTLAAFQRSWLCVYILLPASSQLSCGLCGLLLVARLLLWPIRKKNWRKSMPYVLKAFQRYEVVLMSRADNDC